MQGTIFGCESDSGYVCLDRIYRINRIKHEQVILCIMSIMFILSSHSLLVSISTAATQAGHDSAGQTG